MRVWLLLLQEESSSCKNVAHIVVEVIVYLCIRYVVPCVWLYGICFAPLSILQLHCIHGFILETLLKQTSVCQPDKHAEWERDTVFCIHHSARFVTHFSNHRNFFPLASHDARAIYYYYDAASPYGDIQWAMNSEWLHRLYSYCIARTTTTK